MYGQSTAFHLTFFVLIIFYSITILWEFYTIGECYFHDNKIRCHVTASVNQWYNVINVSVFFGLQRVSS